MDIDSVRRRHPTPASPIVSRRPAAMPVTPRSGATPTAARQMRFVPAAAPHRQTLDYRYPYGMAYRYQYRYLCRFARLT